MIFYFKDLLPTSPSIHLHIMISIPSNWDQTQDLFLLNGHHPNSPLTHLVPSYKLPKPACTWKPQESQYTIQQSLTPLIRDLKLKFWAGIFKDSICTCGKNLKFFWYFKNLCSSSKVTLVECKWLIFKLHFGLDNDLYWIWAFLTFLCNIKKIHEIFIFIFHVTLFNYKQWIFYFFVCLFVYLLLLQHIL